MRVAVVGAGVAGLAAANRVRELDPDADVTVLEASHRAGGLVRSEITDGFVIERGPDAILTEKPAALRLAERVGLADEVVSTRPHARGAYVVHRGRLERVPEGFALLAPVAPWSFLRSPLLSWRGKSRAALDLVLPRRRDTGDESLASFVSRRFGRELLDRLAQPLAGGIYGTPPERLSMEATMPRFLEVERAHRSVAWGMRRARKTQRDRSAGVRYGMFVNFRGGMQTLSDALAARLGDRLRLGMPVTGVRAGARRWHVDVGDGAPLEADAIILAVPAWRAAELTAPLDAPLSELLGSIPYGSTAAVAMAWPRADVPHALDASGFVVPAAEKRPLLACTWLSEKWPGRAPPDMALLRAFVSLPHLDATQPPDERLQACAREQLRELMGIEAAPRLVRVDRYVGAMPRYELGHLDRVTRIEQRVADHPGLELAGNAYRGIGIADAVRSGEEAAARAVSPQHPRTDAQETAVTGGS